MVIEALGNIIETLGNNIEMLKQLPTIIPPSVTNIN